MADLQERWQRHRHYHVSAPVVSLPGTTNAVVLSTPAHQARGPQTPPVRSPGDANSVHIAPALYAASEGKAVVDVVPFERRCRSQTSGEGLPSTGYSTVYSGRLQQERRVAACP